MEKAPVQLSPEEKKSRLDKLSVFINSKRTEAVEARKTSGIETVWLSAEEAYLGIDDANRDQFSNARWAKPTSMAGPITVDRKLASDNKSSAFVRLTSRYVDAGVAKLGEILFPVDDKPFSIEPTPVPDMVMQLSKDNPAKPITPPSQQPAMPGAMPGAPAGMQPPAQGMPQPGQPMPGQPAQPQPVELSEAEKSEDMAKKAETRIYDWMVDCKAIRENRKVLHDSARIGVGVMKGPVPEIIPSQAIVKNGGVIALEMVQKIAPIIKRIDPWNLFPDPACGEDIHSGDFIFERDYISPKTLRELKDLREAGYIASQIEQVLNEGPGKCNITTESSHNQAVKRDKNRFEIWYYYGSINRKGMEAAEVDGLIDGKGDIFAIITMVNDTVIRATINPLSSGKFPYHAHAWSRRDGHWAGVGIAEQVSVPQRMVNALTRAMMNNAGLASGLQIIMDRTKITPADNNWQLTPNKMWYNTTENPMDDVRAAITSITFPDLHASFLAQIEYAFRLAEEATNIPLITQGQTGPTTPETLGATQLQNSNAATLLRSVGYSWDDAITEPIVRAYYEWLLLDPDVPNDEKGDFIINAHGSIAMVERAIQDQFLIQVLGMTQNPGFDLDPKKVAEEVLKSKHIDPRKVQMSEEDIAKRAQQPPPEDPRITAAKIMAESRQKELETKGQQDAQKTQALLTEDQQKTQATLQVQQQIEQERNQLKLKEIQDDTDRDTAYVNAQTQKNQNDHIARMEELKFQKELALIQRDLKILDYANRKEISLDDVKAELSKEAMKLQTQKELSAAAMEMDVKGKAAEVGKQVTTPPTEPAGRAQNGQAYAE